MRSVLLIAAGSLALAALSGCTTVDPGPNFVVPNVTFDADYFYCHVEPQVIFQSKCGDKTNGSCHYTSSAVSGMVLVSHPPIDCGGGDHPLSTILTGPGSAAETNLEQASLFMDQDYTNAPFYLRPTQLAPHPVKLFNPDPNDPEVMIIATWAQK